MAQACEKCRFRAYAEKRPGSFAAWLWRWHTGFCPGWKRYRKKLAAREGADR